jgi:hypothetical protein
MTAERPASILRLIRGRIVTMPQGSLAGHNIMILAESKNNVSSVRPPPWNWLARTQRSGAHLGGDRKRGRRGVLGNAPEPEIASPGICTKPCHLPGRGLLDSIGSIPPDGRLNSIFTTGWRLVLTASSRSRLGKAVTEARACERAEHVKRAPIRSIYPHGEESVSSARNGEGPVLYRRPSITRRPSQRCLEHWSWSVQAL